MPYGMAKEAGGDTPASDQKMENCVTQLVAQGHDKVSAIKICKSAIDSAILKRMGQHKKGRA